MGGGEKTRHAIAAQPDWLARVPGDRRASAGPRLLYTGCGTSFHAAQTGGDAVQALELVLRPEREADLLVCVSHEGTTQLTLEAARAWEWADLARHRRSREPAGGARGRGRRLFAGARESWCHTASYTAAVAALAALRGEDVAWLPEAVADVLAGPRLPVSEHERWLVVGAGRDWPTAQEAVLKLREGAHVAAEALHTEQLLHGYLAAVDEGVRAFVLEGEGRAEERARGAVAALRELGADVTLLPTRHPAVDVVAFQLLTVDLAEARGVDPDPIRRDDPRWARARELYA